MKKIFSLKPILVGLGCAGALNGLVLASPAQIPATLGNLPLYFEAGPSQVTGPARFVTRGCNYQFLLSPAEVQIGLGKTGVRPAEVRMDFTGSNPGAQMSGATELPGKINYLTGNNPAAWRTGVATFARVQVEQLYSGINLVYYGNQRQLEYDFTIAPGADPDAIKIRFDGVDKISVGPEGELVLALGRDKILQPAPIIYQMVGGVRKAVSGGYRLQGKHTLAFTVGKYNHQVPLVIDPILSFSTYFGGNSSDNAWSIALDTNGFIYVAGQTLSNQKSATNTAPFSTPGVFQTNFQGGVQVGDAFVAKFDNSCTNLIYLTYLGGNSDDAAYGLAVDHAGDVYVAGATESANFPIRNGIYTNISGAFNTHVRLYPADAFVAELNPSGSNLVYSTYLGGESSDAAYGIALDSSNNAYVTGFTYSTNFPTTPNAFQKQLACPNSVYFNANAFVTEISAGGSNLVYSSYLGGTNYDVGKGIAVDSSNYVYVTGFTASTNFPITNAIPQFVQTNIIGTNQVLITNSFTSLNGATNLTSADDAFVAKFAPACTSLIYSTFLGGANNDVANSIAVDGMGNAYVTGWTVSTNFPNTITNIAGLYNGLTNNASFALPPITNAFLTQITWSGSNAAIGYSTVFGGTNFGVDVGYGVAVDSSGNVYVVGASSTTNFPAINTPFLLGATNAGGSDAFVIVFTNNATGVLYSGYLGGSGNDYGYGIAVDSLTNVYIAGLTSSANFPTLNPYQSSLNGTSDAFLAKIGGTVLSPQITAQPTNQTVAVNTTVTLVSAATGTPPLSFQWQVQGTNLIWTNVVNGGSISGATNATLTIFNAQTTNSGNYQVIVTNFGGSVTSLVAVLTVTNIPPTITQQPMSQTIGVGSTAVFNVNGPAPEPPYFFQWLKNGIDLTNGTNISGSIISGSTNFQLTLSNAQTNDNGGYSIIVSNVGGSVTSSVAVLTVVAFPTIIVPPTNQTVGLGSTATFVVTAVGAAPLSYQWQTNGTDLVNGGRISGATNATLIITNAQTGDDGGYTVIVTNSVGSVTSSPPAVLTVALFPTFTGITAVGGGGGFIMNGVGGTNNGTYFVLTSTNLLTPLGLWTPIATNQFGSLGQFVFTNTPPTNVPQLFYILQM